MWSVTWYYFPSMDTEGGVGPTRSAGHDHGQALCALAVRSTVAVAAVDDVDVEEAAGVDGVVAVLTATEIGSVLAVDHVDYVGEPVALAVAATEYAAADAAGCVIVDYDPTEPFVSAIGSVGGPDGGLAGHVLDEAAERRGDVVPTGRAELSVDLAIPRTAPVSPAPVEYLAVPTDRGCDLTAPVASERSGSFGASVAEILGPAAPAIGLVATGRETTDLLVDPREAALAVAAARHLGRPVRLFRPRSDELVAGPHHAGHRISARVYFTADGRVAGLAVDHLVDLGARGSAPAAELAWRAVELVATAYAFPAVEWRLRSVRTNTAPAVVEDVTLALAASYAVERTLDHVAAALEMGALAVRRANATPATAAVLDRIAEAPLVHPATGDGTHGVGTALVATPDGRVEAHRCTVTIDPRTGEVRIDRYEGWGGSPRPDAMARSVAAGLYEAVAYDEEGQPRSGTLIDYLVPAAPDLPEWRPSADGAPGVPAPHVVVAAIDDATAFPLGTLDPIPPLSPARVRDLMRSSW